ncbi:MULTISPECIES: hypothetical protein [Nocardia]|uniref:hypothetical protein n=1 Tax=Nocardia TaxID=1817 RepID=UPI002457DAE7|nr:MULTISPECIES: hypothetical protein [Nocardia]
MPDPTSNPSTSDLVPHSPAPDPADVESRAGLRLQFCHGDDDLTAHPAADGDVSEVRLWDGEVCLIAVTRDHVGWGYSAGDVGHRIPDEHLHARFADWHQAVHTLTGFAVTPE